LIPKNEQKFEPHLADLLCQSLSLARVQHRCIEAKTFSNLLDSRNPGVVHTQQASLLVAVHWLRFGLKCNPEDVDYAK
jgi:hypothetical protein